MQNTTIGRWPRRPAPTAGPGRSRRTSLLIWSAAVSLPLLLGLRPLPAGDGVLSPRDVARLKQVTRVAISPDGRHAAYSLAVPRQIGDEPDGPSHLELHLVNPRGASRAFVTGKVSVQTIQWTPDSRQIAYVAQRAGDDQPCLYLIPVDGGESRRAIAHATAVRSPVIDPGGQQVAFLATPPVEVDRKQWGEQGFSQEVYEEDLTSTKVWIAPLDGSAAPRMLDLPGSAARVAWHPHRPELAVVLAPSPRVDDSYMFQRVKVVDLPSGRIVEQIQNPGKLGMIEWSPDGRHLAIVSAEDIHDPHEGRLMVAAIPGDGSLRDLMPDYQAHVTSFAWLGEDRLIWVAGEGTKTSLGTVSLDGTRQLLQERSGPVFSSLSLSAAGDVCLLGDTPQSPQEVYRLAAGETQPRRLTHSNPWLETLSWAEQETVVWKARDGLELQGVLIKPLNYQAGRRYPLIMLVHGGPEAHVSDGWLTSYSNPGQVAAARGFAVFYPNYRGSTGRGVAFSKLGQEDAAGKEFDDLVDGVDHLIETGLVDRDRVGITGGSYGGYASAWGATYYADRFAASVMFVGISDNVSKVGTTDIPEEMYLVHHRKRLWDDWDYFLQRSPIRHVQRHKTPLLILHGKNDPRVHPSQSLELYRHLKTLQQAPVRLILYEGEGHGNRKAAARFDYNLRMLRWMEHYLMGPGGEMPPHELDYAAELE